MNSQFPLRERGDRLKKLHKFKVFLSDPVYCWLVGLAKIEKKTVSIKLEEIIQKEMTGNE